MKNEAMMIAGVLLVIFGVGFAHERQIAEAEVKKLKQGVDAKVEADVSETMQEALTGELRKH